MDDRKDSEILAEAYERFQRAEDYYAESRQQQVKDLKFLAGNGENGYQWPDNVLKERQADGRPALTINQMPQFVRQVTNDFRQNRPAIKVRPVGDASEEVAETFAGLIRDIEIRSDADVAIDTAVESAAACGEGYFRIVTDYADDDSFEQVIKIARIRNRFAVYLDPASTSPEGADAEWGMVFEDVARDSAEAQYGKISGWDEVGGMAQDWCDKNTVRVCDYYYKRYSDAVLYMTDDGPTDKKPKRFKSQRKVRKCTVYACKIAGDKVIDKTVWPGRDIPIIKVIGEEHDIGDKCILQGMVRNSKDAQQAFNFHYTALTEFLALQPKSPWVVAEGQDEGYEHEFQEAHKKNRAIIHYKPTDINGNMVPPPQRAMPPQASPAQFQMLDMSQELLRSTFGMYNPSLGQSSVEKSGVAIMARERQADTGTYHYHDNSKRALRYCGRQLVDVIQAIYDTRRVERIRDAEDNEQTIVVDRTGQPVTEEQDGDKTRKVFDLSLGRYDIYIDTGPSFSTRKLEANAAMAQWVQSAPQLLGIMGDLMIKAQDWPGAEEMAKRLQATLPEQIRQTLEQDGVDPQVQQMQMQAKQAMAQMAGQMEALQQALQEQAAEKQALEAQLKDKQAEIQIKQAELQIKATEADIASKDVQAKVQIAAMNNETKLQIESMGQEFEAIKQRLEAVSGDVQSAKPESVVAAISESQGQVAQVLAALVEAMNKPKVTTMTAPSGKTYEARTE